MKRQEIVCDYCESECTVETLNMEDPILYCPICGSEIDHDERDYDDWDEDDEAWDQMWYYGDIEFTSEMINDYTGFVYVITDLNNKKKYVGKKLFNSTRRLAPLKGKTRKRKVVKESDWKDYFGSSEEVKLILEENGRESFHREIIHLCGSKGEMSYLEAKEQFDREVLLSDEYYNGIINCKIHRTHVKGLKDDK